VKKAEEKMAEKSRDNQKQEKMKHNKRFFGPIPAIVLALACCLLLWFFFFYQSAYEKLFAIEAARAIPDSENAATMYNKLPGYSSDLLEYDFPNDSSEDATLARPWSGEDYPELAMWFEEREDIIDDLIRASKIEQCRFPLTDFPKGAGLHGQRLKSLRTWTFFLVRSANNDIAEGRIEKALEKCFCLIRMGRHNRQQPFSLDFLIGINIESMALRRMRTCIVESDLTNENLLAIETAISQPNDEWTQDLNNMLAVEKLYVKLPPHAPSETRWWHRLKARWQKKRDQDAIIDRIKELYTRLLADRRGNFILTSLRKYRDQNGHWPESLDALLPLVDKNIFIDPQNNGPFFYKLTDDGFTLYSKGPNNIDENGFVLRSTTENGSDKNGADDRPIWPLQIPQTSEKNAGEEQPDTEKREIK
jgi:hypothetical protein